MNTKTYFEITSDEHQHGGDGWEFGKYLWVPTLNKAKQDRYSLMRSPKIGDEVIHILQTSHNGKAGRYLFGTSRVKKPVNIVNIEPPFPGKWQGMGPYYRIELENYNQLPNPLFVPTFLLDYQEEIRADIVHNKPRFYPFTTRGPWAVQTVQGIYLANASGALRLIVLKAIGLQDVPIEVLPETSDLYLEEKRLLSERYLFSRNPKLTAAAKARYGTTCAACGFNFDAFYGAIGEGYIEVHHKNPLAERASYQVEYVLTTDVNEVTVLCANCHRMVHRRRPALTLEALKGHLEATRLERQVPVNECK